MLGCHYLQTPVSPVCRRQSACQRTAWPLPTVWFYAVSDRSALAHTRNCYDAVLFAADLSPELCCEFENYRVARKKWTMQSVNTYVNCVVMKFNSGAILVQFRCQI